MTPGVAPGAMRMKQCRNSKDREINKEEGEVARPAADG
jgi:hypothetical protein